MIADKERRMRDALFDRAIDYLRVPVDTGDEPEPGWRQFGIFMTYADACVAITQETTHGL